MDRKQFQLLFMATNPGAKVSAADAIYDQVYPSLDPVVVPVDVAAEKAKDAAIGAHLKALDGAPVAQKAFRQLPYLDQLAELGL